jgi:hypothetical protein
MISTDSIDTDVAKDHLGRRWVYPFARSVYQERSYSVKLVKGAFSENPGHVTAAICDRCRTSVPELVAVCCTEEAALYGCAVLKCDKVLIKVVL